VGVVTGLALSYSAVPASADVRTHCDIVPCGVPDQIPPSSEIAHELKEPALIPMTMDVTKRHDGSYQNYVEWDKTDCDTEPPHCGTETFVQEWSVFNSVWEQYTTDAVYNPVDHSVTEVGPTRLTHLYADNFSLHQTSTEPPPFSTVYIDEDHHWESEDDTPTMAHAVVTGTMAGQGTCSTGGNCRSASGCLTDGICLWTQDNPSEIMVNPSVTGHAGIVPDFTTNGSTITGTPWRPASGVPVITFPILGKCVDCVS
jgi:hypothetical protein